QRTSRCPAFLPPPFVRSLAAKFRHPCSRLSRLGRFLALLALLFLLLLLLLLLAGLALLAFSDFLSSVSELALLALLRWRWLHPSTPAAASVDFPKMSRTLLLCTLVAALILTVAAAPSVGDDGWHQRRGGAEPYRFFMLKRLLKRPADDRDIEQLLKQLNDWSSESRSDSVIFRLRRGGGGGVENSATNRSARCAQHEARIARTLRYTQLAKYMTRKAGKQQAELVGGPQPPAPCAAPAFLQLCRSRCSQVEAAGRWAAPASCRLSSSSLGFSGFFTGGWLRRHMSLLQVGRLGQ
uniref:Pro-kuma_activ domain-containing protein n=2 Tax=Macrostomum lignano TaxID=282301 RepID=A0A1I8FGT8_9PLAT